MSNNVHNFILNIDEQQVVPYFISSQISSLQLTVTTCRPQRQGKLHPPQDDLLSSCCRYVVWQSGREMCMLQGCVSMFLFFFCLQFSFDSSFLLGLLFLSSFFSLHWLVACMCVCMSVCQFIGHCTLPCVSLWTSYMLD